MFIVRQRALDRVDPRGLVKQIDARQPIIETSNQVCKSQNVDDDLHHLEQLDVSSNFWVYDAFSCISKKALFGRRQSGANESIQVSHILGEQPT